MKKQTRARYLVVIAAIILFASLSLKADPADDKKKKEDSTRKIEIIGDKDKIRAALIKLEMDQGGGYILGDEQASRVIFTEPKAKGMRSVLAGQSHFRDLFVFAAGSSPTATTIYATTEFCAQMYRDQRNDCKVQNHKHWTERLDKLLTSLKAEVEGKQ